MITCKHAQLLQYPYPHQRHLLHVECDFCQKSEVLELCDRLHQPY